jgi:muramoyltetrapeptide carboxypeptidase
MASQLPVIKPPVLKKGDTVGIVAPSSKPFEEGHVEFTYKWLQSPGLKYKVGKHVFDSYSDFAGRDEDRLEDFHAMWADKEVAAVMPIRGGNGSVRLLAKMDFGLIASNPKIFIGYSDITGLLIPIHQRTGLVTFHGPDAGSFFEGAYTYHYFRKAVMSNRPIGVVVDPPSEMWKPKYPPPRMVITPGKATGILIGGSLTLIRQLMGTPFEIETDGKLLFIEDVGEEPHSVDSMLCQLLLANKLQNCAGIIFGESVDCRPGKSRRHTLSLNFSVERVIRERLGGLGIPVAYGLRFGHGLDKFTLPLGVTATLDVRVNDVRFRIEEAATCQ